MVLPDGQGKSPPRISDCFDRYTRNMQSSASASKRQARCVRETVVASSANAGNIESGEGLADEVLAHVAGVVTRWRGVAGEVTVVAIDGQGAAGKSTIASQLCAVSGASLVHTDDFFLPREQITRKGDRRGGLGSYYDVARLRAEALEPLRAGHEAIFDIFDWDSGTVSSEKARVEPHGLVVLEGVYSSAPLLADLVDKAVYVLTPESERLSRLHGRIAAEDWDAEWLAAEELYFTTVRRPESFDLVIRGSRTVPPVPREARVPFEGRHTGNVSEHR